MVTGAVEFEIGMRRDLARWRDELRHIGPDPLFATIRQQLMAFITEGERLLGPL